MKVIVFLLTVLLTLLTFGKTGFSSSTLERLNYIRLGYGLNELKEDERLDRSAMKKACDMRDRNYWAHATPEGVMSWGLFLEEGFDYQLAGEIMGKDCEDCIPLWMESPPHKKVIIDQNYTSFGIGKCGVYTVVHYGTEKELL